MDDPLIFFFNLGWKWWNGFRSNFTGWVGIGAENLSHEDLSLRSDPKTADPNQENMTIISWYEEHVWYVLERHRALQV